MTLALFGGNALLLLCLMTLLWLVSVRLRDASIVDPWWSIAFLLVAAGGVVRTGATPAKLLLVGMVALWAVRLFLHLLLRSRGKPEDPRYARFREKYGPGRYWWVSFFQVFLLQGVLVLLLSLPLQLATGAAAPDPIGPLQLCALLPFLAGLAIEALADLQLQRFRDDPSNRGQVMDRGLWRYSRHPNYFGEALLFWGLWLGSLRAPFGLVTGLTALSPALMTFLLLRVSGVTMLDAHLRATRPGYRDYLARTSPFLPRRPKEAP